MQSEPISNSERSNPLRIIKCKRSEVKSQPASNHSTSVSEKHTTTTTAAIHHVSYPSVFIVHKTLFKKSQSTLSLPCTVNDNFISMRSLRTKFIRKYISMNNIKPKSALKFNWWCPNYTVFVGS